MCLCSNENEKRKTNRKHKCFVVFFERNSYYFVFDGLLVLSGVCFFGTDVGFGGWLSIGDGGGSGPKLYLDGSRKTNWRKSDLCIPFLINPLPQRKVDKGPAKKNALPPPIPTHQISFEETQIAIGSKIFTYKVPFLIDVEGPGKLLAQPLYRENLPWASE